MPHKCKDNNCKHEDEETKIVHNIIEKIGIAPDKQEIREQQNLYQACELGKVLQLMLSSIIKPTL